MGIVCNGGMELGRGTWSMDSREGIVDYGYYSMAYSLWIRANRLWIIDKWLLTYGC